MKEYEIGEETYRRVFQKANITNLHDLQAVLDAVEEALRASPEKQSGSCVCGFTSPDV